MADYSIRVTTLKWYQLQKLNNAVCLLGTVAAGKTTIGYLIKKYIDGQVDSNFIEDAKGFSYDNQINPKTIKSLTIYPKLFKIRKNNLNIVQVPSRIYQPEKKRINLDRLLNMSGLCNVADKISLLFITDARNTGTKIDNWKKVFKSILDNLHSESITQQLSNSIGFIIAKGSSQIDKQTTVNRMKNLMKTLQTQERQQYIKLIDHIMAEKKVCIFRKPQKDTDNVNQDIQSMFNFFCELPMFETNDHLLVDQQYIELTKEQQKYLQEFNVQLINILTTFKAILNELFFNQGYKNLTQLFESNKNLLTKLANDVSQQQQGIANTQCKPLTDRFDQIRISECQSLDVYRVCNFYIKLKRLMTCGDQKKVISQLISAFSQNGLIRKTTEWKSIYLRLIQYQIFQQRFSTPINLNYKKIVYNNFQALFLPSNQGKIAQAFINTDLPPNKEPSFYNGVYEILQIFYPNDQSNQAKSNQKVELLKSSLILMKFDTKNAKQQLPLLWKITQNKKLYANDQDSKKFARNFTQILAKMCYQLKHYEIASIIFYNCGLYHSSLKCYQNLGFNSDKNQQYQNQDLIKNYIDLLIEMNLFEKAYSFCYSYVEMYQDKREQILNRLKEIKTKQLLNFDTNFQNKFLRKQYHLFSQYVPTQVSKQIQQIVHSMINN